MTTLSSAIMYRGDVRPVMVECKITKGIGIHLVGIPDASVKEILLNICTALQHLGYRFPGRKVVINIAGAGQQKPKDIYHSLDLAVALAILIEDGQIEVSKEALENYRFFAGVNLEGELRAPYTGLSNDNDTALVVDWYFRTSGWIMGYPADDTCSWDSAADLEDAINQLKAY